VSEPNRRDEKGHLDDPSTILDCSKRSLPQHPKMKPPRGLESARGEEEMRGTHCPKTRSWNLSSGSNVGLKAACSLAQEEPPSALSSSPPIPPCPETLQASTYLSITPKELPSSSCSSSERESGAETSAAAWGERCASKDQSEK
jgi:hypothetical protein